MKTTRRHSTITVTDAAGIVHIGAGASLAQAARDLGERHAAEQRCRLCGEPVSEDGGTCQASLEEGAAPHAYVVPLQCQADALESLAEASHAAVSRWTLTRGGWAVLWREGRPG